MCGATSVCDVPAGADQEAKNTVSILLVVQAGQDGTDRRRRQMASFANTSVLSVALHRLRDYADGPVVVAISDLPADDEIEALARANGAAAVRGPSDDLLARYVEVIADYPAEHLVRVTADSPFIDHHLVSQVVRTHIDTNADYTSNTLLRTHPLGLEVEAIRSDAILDAAEQATDPRERAGVTTFVQRRPSTYVLASTAAPADYEDHDWRVTDAASLTRLTELLNKSGGDLSLPWDKLAAFDRPNPPAGPIRLRVARENVAAALPMMTETLGYPPDPMPIHDAARRSWGVWAGEELVGAIVVSVQNGWGTLAGSFVPGLDGTLAAQALQALDDRLLADDQVIALTVDGSRIRTYRS